MTTNPNLSPLLDAKATAEILNVSERTLWTLTNNGTIAHIRVGRAIRYDRTDLARWIAKQKRKTAGKIPDLLTDGTVTPTKRRPRRHRRHG
jgi:excisionase family DNA binding protein